MTESELAEIRERHRQTESLLAGIRKMHGPNGVPAIDGASAHHDRGALLAYIDTQVKIAAELNHEECGKHGHIILRPGATRCPRCGDALA